MNEHMTRWKVALTAFFSALGTMLGWKGIMALYLTIQKFIRGMETYLLWVHGSSIKLMSCNKNGLVTCF